MPEMADDINGPSRVTLATLGAQVASLDRDYNDVKRTLVALDNRIDSSISSLGTKFESALSSLANKVDAKSTTQWPLIFSGLGVLVTIVVVIGGMAYMPIQRDAARLDSSVAAILDRGVFQREYTSDQSRVADGLRGLRADVNVNIQQQRYNVDQERLTKMLDEIRSSIEAIRMRTYDAHGRAATVEQFQKDLDRRLDAISARLAQHIRDRDGRTPVAP